MKVSDIVIDFLLAHEIDTVFTVSGGGNIHLMDSLRKFDVDTICVHHEQAAVMAAEGYYRMKGKMAAVIVTTGPGGTNTLTGVLGMWQDSIPCMIISGQVQREYMSVGTGCRQIGDQEFDIVPMVKDITKYAITIMEPADILNVLHAAYGMACHGRPGPSWVDIPLDIQSVDLDTSNISYFGETRISSHDLEHFSHLLANSERPMVIIGGGIRLSNSYKKLNDFLVKFQIPVVTGAHSAVDAVDNTYEYYAGRIGILGQKTSNWLVQEADLLLCIGTRLPVKMTGYDTLQFSPKSKKIMVDIDPNEIKKHKFKIDLSITSDINDFFDAITEIKLDLDINNWKYHVKSMRTKQEYYLDKHINLQRKVSLYYFMHKAYDYFYNYPIITSNGSAHVVPMQMYRLRKDQRMFTNVGCASMGYGLPAAIGACIANNKKEVICIEGDGSIMMNLQELETMVSNKLPIKLIIVNNDGYLSIKLTQQSFFKGMEFASGKDNGVTLPNFKKIAAAFNIPYYSIKNNSEIDKGLNDMSNHEGYCILEVFAWEKEKHEPKVIHKVVDGKIIPGTLMDMS